MKFSNVMSNAGEWLRGEGPHHQIVISSRVRLARNLRNRAFPGWAKKAERTAILELIKPHVEELPEMQDSFSELLQDLSALEKQVLVERHLISREHAAKSAGSAVIMNRRQTLSIMINEEDHLRMQSMRSGLQLKQAFKLLDKIDTALENELEFAYDQRLGYLTACPTNVGTGMRASAMLHLPGLVLSELINQVVQALSLLSIIKLGIDLGAFPEDKRLPIDELFMDTQPAHLQKTSQQKLNAEERDHLRAQIIRARLKVLPKPDISKLATDSGNGSNPAPSEQ